ncbi:uncharacterized protein [Nicotiana sylvestris]|uniref:uncharacterized protein n=1 Tax=Nicotiana sylvestris TaxID=4096 RepID=UPI00388C8B3C
MVNFPALSVITMRNSFEPLNKGSWCTSNVPPDKGRGDYYTWSNKQSDAEMISSRIDRAFGNYEWMMQWDHVITEYRLPYIYDHSPMVITLHSAPKPGKTPFRFFNMWADHDIFISIVERVWNQSYTMGKMKNIWVKLKELRPLFRTLNTEHFRTITMKIEHIKISLEEVQQKINTTYNDFPIEEEKRLLQNLEKWSLIEESVLRKKARTKWIKLGDKLTHPESIKQEVVEFYKSLMGSVAHSLSPINKVIMNNGPILSQQQKLALCAEKAWMIIKDEVNQSIKEFFSTGKLYKAKLISKVLAGRIQQVIASVISEAQAGFIPGRRIIDNIILAHELVKGYTRKNISARCMIKIDLQKLMIQLNGDFWSKL